MSYLLLLITYCSAIHSEPYYARDGRSNCIKQLVSCVDNDPAPTNQDVAAERCIRKELSK